MKLTPGMMQYMEQKEKYPDCILLFRMGDFYETFFEDAVKISKILNITLTSRGKGESKAPLAGIPYHSIDRYIGKLVNQGNKVAICEQIEDPKKAVGIVKRAVVRIITPGTAIEDSILVENSNNYIASLFGENGFGLAFADISTGSFLYTEVKKLEDIFSELSRKKVSELLVSHPTKGIVDFCNSQNIFLNEIPSEYFWITKATESIKSHYGLNSKELGFEDKEYGACASGALLTYLHETQKQKLGYLKKPKNFKVTQHMLLDFSTIKNLELLKNVRDNSSRGSLLSVIDKTTSQMGSRLIKNWITHPLKDRMLINSRLGSVNELKSNIMVCDEIREHISQLFDIERLVSKISYKMTNPRDIVNLKNTLRMLPIITSQIKNLNCEKLISLSNFPDVSLLTELIEKAISEDIENQEILRSGEGYSQGGTGRRDIGIVKKGYNDELDELYDLKLNTKEKIKNLEEQEQARTGMNLKVGYNKIFGYYIEVSNKNLSKVPNDYIRKQTLVNGERFITEDLKNFEEKLFLAEQKIIQIEDRILQEVVDEIIRETSSLQKISENVAEIDILSGFAKVAYENNYIMPEITEDYELKLKDSRHPVIELLENSFVPNDCHLFDKEFLMLITGPNMAGKSTFMRQVALIIILAQIGCFVPAKYAKIGIVDQIFSRIGAYDDLTMGQSTFMVEMVETARIINNATDRSFIILDEIGRGTSTFDGVSIAWSVAEYILKKINAKTLFATHYHVLTKLEEHQNKGIVNYNISVSEEDDKIVFLRKIKRGGTDKSYGVQVAKLAGLPIEIINKAKEIQMRLEEEDEMIQKISFQKIPESDNYSKFNQTTLKF